MCQAIACAIEQLQGPIRFPDADDSSAWEKLRATFALSSYMKGVATVCCAGERWYLANWMKLSLRMKPPVIQARPYEEAPHALQLHHDHDHDQSGQSVANQDQMSCKQQKSEASSH
eukprot:m.52008 g.52008  ORF g.52008 m.52008 type:complete len:116 (+) comp11277_c0_seq4:669-1016(+)